MLPIYLPFKTYLYIYIFKLILEKINQYAMGHILIVPHVTNLEPSKHIN
jgi:hypothetical protein